MSLVYHQIYDFLLGCVNVLSVRAANSTAFRLNPILMTTFMLISSEDKARLAELRRDVPAAFDVKLLV